MPGDIYTAEVERRSPGLVIVRRQFDAPRDLVWKAYTSPELLLRWLNGSYGWEMTRCEMDLRVGGAYHWRWKQEAGPAEFGFTGKLTEIAPPARMVHTQFYDPGTLGGDMGDGCLVTVEMTEADGVTTVTTQIDFYTDEAREIAMSTGMTDGMEISYQNLDAVLTKVA